jgi:hypothetical protein
VGEDDTVRLHQQITLLLWALYSSVQKGPSCGQPFFGGEKKGVLLMYHQHNIQIDTFESQYARTLVGIHVTTQ